MRTRIYRDDGSAVPSHPTVEHLMDERSCRVSCGRQPHLARRHSHRLVVEGQEHRS
jgi:hypothetical protein